jgi:hypothetical protein
MLSYSLALMTGLIFWFYPPTLSRRLKRQARMLDQDISKALDHFHQGAPSVQVRPFKFYGVLVERLIKLSVSMGVSCEEGLLRLRQALQKDCELSAHCSQLLTQGLIRYLVIASFNWMLLWGSSWALEEAFVSKLGPTLAGVQLLGLLLFWVLFQWRHWSLFHGYCECFQGLYGLVTLHDCGQSISQVVALSGVRRWKFTRLPWKAIEMRTLDLIQRWTQQGLTPEREFQVLIDQTWQDYQQSMEGLKGELNQAQLVLALVFGLGPYFAFLLQMMSWMQV